MFSETSYVCVLRAKFEVSSIILTSFRHGGNGGEGRRVILTPPENESPPRLGVMQHLKLNS